MTQITMRAMFGVMATATALTTAAEAQTYNPPISDEQIMEKYCVGSPRVKLFVREALSPTVVFCHLDLILPLAPATACDSVRHGLAEFNRESSDAPSLVWPDMTLGDLYVDKVWANARYCKKLETSWKFSPYALG